MKQLNRLFPNKVTIQLPQVSCYINLILQFIMLLTCYLQFIYLFRFQTCTGRGFTLWLEAAVRSWHWNYESSVQCCQHSLSESGNISLIIFNALSCCTFCVYFQFLWLFLDENSCAFGACDITCIWFVVISPLGLTNCLFKDCSCG